MLNTRKPAVYAVALLSLSLVACASANRSNGLRWPGPSSPPPPAPLAYTPPVAPPPPACMPPAPGQPVSLDGCATGDTLVLRGVNFEFNQDLLTVNAKTLLNQVADALLARTGIQFEIGGHTDAKGTDEYNQALSERRASAVRNYLIRRGVDAGSISSRGYGESSPIADNATDDGAALNRRVELKLVQLAGTVAASAAPVPVPQLAAMNAPGAAATGSSTVTIAGYSFAPATLMVAAGTTVTWTNADPTTHSIAFPDGDHSLATGASYSRSFAQPGKFAYACSRHPGMGGTVVVN